MKPFFHTTLSLLEGVVTVGSLFVVALVVFVGLPAIPRTVDKNSGRLIAQARAAASFGNSAFRSGGALYRVSVYEKRFVVCFMSARSYSYADVRVICDKSAQRGQLMVDLNGTRLALSGNAESLERVANALSDRVGGKRSSS